MKEFELIKTWFDDRDTQRADVLLGTGDDAALIKLAPDQELVTTNACVWPKQNPLDNTPEQLASRCYQQALQALLQQQATPAWAVLCLCLAHVDSGWLERFSTRLKAALQHEQVQLIGGDTTHGPTLITLFLSGYRAYRST